MYDGLLLSKGGGIITDIKKSVQQGEPTIIIGLGGTGVDALKVIKKKVYEQLIPDNPDGDIPEYKRIGFLAVDTDYIETEGNEFYHLKYEECFNIGVTSLNAKMDADIQSGAEEFKWLQPLELLGENGTGAVRQVGRYCLFKNIDQVTDRIRKLKKDVTVSTDDSEVNVHIIAGISGGTGGGTFIDMCYILRDLLGPDAILLGYLFMPDIALSKAGIADNNLIANRIKSNSYAMLKELEYTMNLDEAGDSFSQCYGGVKQYCIGETSRPPLSLCHLISATDEKGESLKNGYTYGLNNVAEYIVSYLAQVQDYRDNDARAFGISTITGHISNAIASVYMIRKRHGENLNYHTFGTAVAKPPVKEIEAYLAAELYRKLENPLLTNIPGAGDAEIHAEKMGITLDNLRDMLCGAGEWSVTDANDIRWEGVYDFSIEDACNTTASAADDGISLTMPDIILTPVRDWKNKNLGALTKNFEDLTKGLNSFDLISKNSKTDTLIGMVLRYLQNEVISDINYGAVYASRLIHNQHEKSLNDYLDDLIKTVNNEVSMLRVDLTFRAKGIEAAAESCKNKSNGTFATKKKQAEAVDEYKDAVRSYNQTLLNAEIGEKLADMIEILKKQIDDESYSGSLYHKYFRPMENMLLELKDTFDSNREFLNDNKTCEDQTTLNIVDFKDIKSYICTEANKMSGNSAAEYRMFADNIMAHYSDWADDDRHNVEKMISSCMANAFSELLNTSMERLLDIKYGTQGNSEKLQYAIETDLLEKRVLAEAEPKFCKDLRCNTYPAVRSTLSVPVYEANICAAAENIASEQGTITVRHTGFGDRISATKFESGIPLYAYGLIDEIERQYNAGGNSAAGRHLYEITDRNKDIDWASLPSVIPYSVRPQSTPNGAELVNLYKEAESVGIIAVHPDKKYDYCVYELEMPQLKGRYDFADGNEFQEYIRMLNSYRDNEGKVSPDAPMHKVHTLPDRGWIDILAEMDYREQCRIDYFIQFKNLQTAARNSIDILDKVDKALEETDNWINEIININI